MAAERGLRVEPFGDRVGRGVLRRRVFRAGLLWLCVLAYPGQRALTVLPVSASPGPGALVKPTAPCLEAG